jgi:predicted NBD/HSP70 family sugar kinase
MNPAILISKRNNMRNILKYIIKKGETSRRVIAKAFRLSTATVTNIINELIGLDLVFDGRKDNAALGRKASLLRFNGRKYRFVAISIINENSEIAFFICNLNGEIEAKDYCNIELFITQQNPDTKIISSIKSAICNFIAIQPDNIRISISCVAISIPGIVINNEMVYAPYFNWKNLPLASTLQAAIGLPVYMENVTRVKATYEMRYIDPIDKNVIYLALSPGIGMVNFFEGNMIRGNAGLSGEIGHMSLNINGEQCYCGSRGCFELYCGENYVLKKAERLLEEHACPVLKKLVTQQGLRINMKTLFLARKMGSIQVHHLLTTTAEYLGCALTNIINCYDPDLILISGNIVEHDPYVYDTAIEELRGRVLSRYSRNLHINHAHLGTNNIEQGLCAVVLENIIDMLIP